MASEPTPRAVPSLSRREREALETLARGDTDKEAAQALGVSLGTVRVYRRRTQAKLGTRGLVQTLLVASRLGMVDLEAIVDEASARAAATREAASRSRASGHPDAHEGP